MTTRRTALLSVSDHAKDEVLADFARGLVEMDWDIIASKGTKAFLDTYDIPSLDVGSIVGDPILDHRVVTLSREIFAGILAKDTAEDRSELERLKIRRIDLVYVSLYPLDEELRKSDKTEMSAREKIDIGGPTLLRAAAKADRWVVSHSSQFQRVLKFLRAPQTKTSDARAKHYLAAEAEERVSRYICLTAQFYDSLVQGDFATRWGS